jgi:hypothetical protein
MIVRKKIFFLSVQCFVKKDKMFLKFLDILSFLSKKSWTDCTSQRDILSYGRFVPRTVLRQGHSNQGRYVLGRFVRGRFVRVPLYLSFKKAIHTVHHTSGQVGADLAASDTLTKIQVLREFGGIYLDTNILFNKPIHYLRYSSS